MSNNPLRRPVFNYFTAAYDELDAADIGGLGARGVTPPPAPPTQLNPVEQAVLGRAGKALRAKAPEVPMAERNPYRGVFANWHDPIAAVLKTEDFSWEMKFIDTGGYYFWLRTPELREVATFCMMQLPGCCGVIVSYHANVEKGSRGKGLGLLLNGLRIEMGKVLGYTVLLCSDVVDNKSQRRILKKNGWKDLLTFTNSRTGNRLALSAINIGGIHAQMEGGKDIDA